MRPTLLLLALAGCPNPDKDDDSVATAACDPAAPQADAPAIRQGAPQAGVAEAALQLPVGTPLSGYTGRCDCFGGEGDVDARDSSYAEKFASSAGVQSAPVLKAFWLSNGDQDFVIVKIALIYPFDGLVKDVEARLSEATGRDLKGKVVLTTNHSHNSYGDFSNTVTYFLGSDKFNREVYERFVAQTTEVALAAWTGLQPAKIGVGFARDWDPQDRVYRDRRGDNDGTQFFDDIPVGRYKSPYLSMIRIDTLDDQPLGVLFDFGIHGTALDTDNAMISTDAPGHLDTVFEERFGSEVVVAHIQGAAGDISPAGSDHGFANLETVGEYAVDPLWELYESIPTSADPIWLEGTGRSVSQLRDDIRVTRGGTTDMHYVPYDEDLVPDNVVYDQNGDIIPAIDEFNVEFGAAFCGEDPAYLPGFAPAEAFPYVNCVELSKMVGIIGGFFDLSADQTALPLPEATKATLGALRFGPVPIRDEDGTTTTDDVFMGFFVGEPTTYYEEQFKRRAAAELGYEHAILVGYSQDEEGYMLLPEDWLLGGYEADINQLGPLQAEHLMERLFAMADEVLATTEVAEDPDPCGIYDIPPYLEWDLPAVAPDATPDAGTRLDVASDYVYSPLYSLEELDAGALPNLAVPAELPRVQGLVELAWYGGDPGVDWPVVTLQRQEGSDWVDVPTTSGRPVSGGPDILVTHTPDPLFPTAEVQRHTWYAAWQAVGHVADRAGLPLGTYRLHVEGQHYVGSETTWPWTTANYTVDSEPFTLVPGALTLAPADGGLVASLDAPARGYRLVDLSGDSQGQNPLPEGTATVTRVYDDGREEVETTTGTSYGRATLLAVDLAEAGLVRVEVADLYGNEGALDVAALR